MRRGVSLLVAGTCCLGAGLAFVLLFGVDVQPLDRSGSPMALECDAPVTLLMFGIPFLVFSVICLTVSWASLRGGGSKARVWRILLLLQVCLVLLLLTRVPEWSVMFTQGFRTVCR